MDIKEVIRQLTPKAIGYGFTIIHDIGHLIAECPTTKVRFRAQEYDGRFVAKICWDKQKGTDNKEFMISKQVVMLAAAMKLEEALERVAEKPLTELIA